MNLIIQKKKRRKNLSWIFQEWIFQSQKMSSRVIGTMNRFHREEPEPAGVFQRPLTLNPKSTGCIIKK